MPNFELKSNKYLDDIYRKINLQDPVLFQKIQREASLVQAYREASDLFKTVFETMTALDEKVAQMYDAIMGGEVLK